ncbi:MAG: hypothetical protein IJD07_01280 [Clostridia bacterium]|nr:hypothetical protein [Clostridia bacterium]
MKKRLFYLFMVTVLLSSYLSGCFFLFTSYELGFSQSEIYASVGETVELTQYLTDKSDEISNVSFSASNTDVGYVSDSRFIVLAKGTATVTARYGNSRASVRIVATYDEVSEMSIYSHSGRAVELNDYEELEFTALTGQGSGQNANIVWTLNGNQSAINGINFYHTPATAGVYTLQATAVDYDISAEYEFVVYDGQQDLSVSYDESLLIQEQPQTVFFALGGMTQKSLVEWQVNGETVKEIIAKTTADLGFEFLPQGVGKYEISCLVNGTTVRMGENMTTTVVVKGDLPIKNLRLDYDDSYPNVYLRWDAPSVDGVFTVSIGSQKYTSETHSDKFSDGCFDATGIIEIFISYTVGLSYAGDEIFSGSSASFYHTAVKGTAMDYLDQKYLNGNYYMTDDQEVYDIFSYAMTFRPDATVVTVNAKPCEQVIIKLFMGYTSEHSPSYLTDIAWKKASQTGSYYLDASGSTEKNGVLKIRISFVTGNIPTNFDTKNKTAYDSLQVPHLSSDNYNGEFAIDSRPLSYDKVSTTEELYFVVNEGYQPNIEQGSSAQQIYETVRETLRKIIDEEMTDAQIVHAIFDYIMWKTSYDYAVLENSDVAQSVQQPAFYLDGVLTTGFAVCDGIAKTFSLMCNIMGIDCKRIVGTARSGEKIAEHAWNKVKLDGEWYMVDCTWSDFLTNVGTTKIEASSHKYFLLSDSDTKYSHFENDSSLYPRTAPVAYDYYDDVQGVFKVKNNLLLSTQIRAIANYAKQNKKYGYKVCGKYYTAQYFAIEIKMDAKIYAEVQNTFYTLLRAKLKEAGFVQGSFSIVDFDEICIVLIK